MAVLHRNTSSREGLQSSYGPAFKRLLISCTLLTYRSKPELSGIAVGEVMAEGTLVGI